MATTKVIDVISRAEIITQDKTSVTWPKAEWLGWFNDAVLFVVNQRSDASIRNDDNFSVDITNSKQELPSDALRLTSVIRNVASGLSIREVDRKRLDDNQEGWHGTTGDDVKHYVYDPRDPKHFYIFPRPTTADHKLELVYTIAPSAIDISNFTTDTTTLPIDDSYLNALLDFMLYRAYSKDADYASNGQRAMAHLQAASEALGIKTQVDMSNDRMPNSRKGATQ